MWRETCDFQLHDDVTAIFVDGEDVDKPPTGGEFNAGDPFFVIEPQARFDEAAVFTGNTAGGARPSWRGSLAMAREYRADFAMFH